MLMLLNELELRYKRNSEHGAEEVRIQQGREGIEPSEEDAYKDKKREKLYVPLTFYYIKDLLREFVNNKYFPDSVLSAIRDDKRCDSFPFLPSDHTDTA